MREQPTSTLLRPPASGTWMSLGTTSKTAAYRCLFQRSKEGRLAVSGRVWWCLAVFGRMKLYSVYRGRYSEHGVI